MDADAFVKCVHQHQDRVFTFARWLLPDSHEAADLTQEAYLRLWRHHQQVSEPAARSWLLRTVSRLAIDRFRKRRPLPTNPADFDSLLQGPSPHDLAIASESSGAFARALSELSIRDRALLYLAHAREHTSPEIARIMEMPDGSVRVALTRARRRLLDRMALLCEEVPA